MLLRFRVVNHRSIRDEAELSFVTGRTGKGERNAWHLATLPVIGIFGSNASGKSTMLEAIDFASSAIADSATKWAERKRFPHRPFALDEVSADKLSEYEFDFVCEGVRYTYGFTSSSSGIAHEWLYSYPQNRRRLVFERAEGSYTFRRGLDGDNVGLSKLTKQSALFLSMAGLGDHPVLRPLQRWLGHSIRFARFSPVDQFSRMQFVRDALEEDPQLSERLELLLPEVDLGIRGLCVAMEEVKPSTKRLFERLAAVMSDGDSNIAMGAEQMINDFRRKVRFEHASETGVTQLPIESESSGTIAWLSLVVPAMNALEHGETLLVDEIDSSLHPRLTASLIKLFSDAWPDSTAQLIFTSHDTSLLNPVSVGLPRDSIWFTEKRADGATSVYSLAEFSPRRNDNVERRYLQGRYGAVPMVSGSLYEAGLSKALTGGEPDAARAK